MITRQKIIMPKKNITLVSIAKNIISVATVKTINSSSRSNNIILDNLMQATTVSIYIINER